MPKKEEKPKRESLESRLKKRKENIKKTFLSCVEEHDPKYKFSSDKYVKGSGGRGLLHKALGDFTNNDKGLFQEILQELKKDKTLYQVGGSMYVLN